MNSVLGRCAKFSAAKAELSWKILTKECHALMRSLFLSVYSSLGMDRLEETRWVIGQGGGTFHVLSELDLPVPRGHSGG